MATTYMNLSLPTVSVTTGPGWASQLNTAFEAIDSHDHSSGKGIRVTPSGLNINADLTMGSNDLTEVRSTRYDNNSGSLGGAGDKNAVYVYGGNLYFNNSSGAAVKITDAGALNAAGLVGSRQQVSVAGTHTILSSDTYTTLKVNTTAARTINLPAASAVGEGRFYIIQDVSGQSETNAITLARSGGDTIDGVGSNFSLSMDNGVWEIESDGLSNWKVTRAMPDFLTKDALTMGNTVLNQSYLSLGSSTAAAGAIRLPNNNYVSSRTTTGTTISMLGLSTQNQITLGDGFADVSVSTYGTMHLTGAMTTTNYISVGSGYVFVNGYFTGSYGLLDSHLALGGTSTATAGALRLANATGIYHRDGANGSNIVTAYLDASDNATLFGGARSIAMTDNKSNYTQIGKVVKVLSANGSTTSTTPQSSSLTLNVKSGETWNIAIDGGVSTPAGNGGYFGFIYPGGTTWWQWGYQIDSAASYAWTSGVSAGDTTANLFDTDGISAPFRACTSFTAGGDGTVTFMYRSYTGGDSTLLLAGSTMIATRGSTT